MPTCHLETPVMQQNRARLPLQDHLLFIQGGRTFLSAMQFKRTISPVTSRETGNEAGAKTCALFGVHCCFMGMFWFSVNWRIQSFELAYKNGGIHHAQTT